MPHLNFNRKDVYGRLMEHFRIKDVDKFCVALEIVGGGKLFSVIVKSEKVSAELLK